MLDELQTEVDLVRVERAVEMIRSGESPERPVVAFTFDDGFIDCYLHLAPALEAHGINAAFFVNPRYIGAGADYIEVFNRTAVRSFGRLPMTEAMVRSLADRGFVIGSHTADHVRLDGDDRNLIADQVEASRAEVEALSGQACSWFAWPYGTYRDISDRALDVALDTYDVVFSSDGYGAYGSEDRRVLNRRHFEVHWPTSHVRYFLRTTRI